MAARKGAGRKPAKNEIAAGLIKALDFLGVLKGPTGQQRMLYMDHVFLQNGWAIGYDGVVAAGHRVDDELSGYVNTKLLGEALQNTSKTFTLSVQESGAFYIESGNYQSLVPALNPELAIATYPDGNLQNAYPIAPAFADALIAAAKVVSDNAEFVVHVSVRTNGSTVMATDGETIIEAYHGSHMPTGLLIPKLFANAVAKAIKLGKELVGFGVSPGFETFTLHFSDQSWLRTNLYQSQWPDGILEHFPNIFNGMQFSPTPDGLFNAVRAVIPFADENRNILVRPGLIRTHPDRRIGAALEVKDVGFDIDIDGKTLLAVEDHALSIAINNAIPALVFQGGMVRGAISGRKQASQQLPEPVTQAESQGWQTTAPQRDFSAPSAGGMSTVAHNDAASNDAGFDNGRDHQPVTEPAKEPVADQGGWGDFKIANVSPPAETVTQTMEAEKTVHRNQQVDPTLYQGLEGLPAGGLSELNYVDDHADDPLYDGLADDPNGVVFDSQAWLASLVDKVD